MVHLDLLIIVRMKQHIKCYSVLVVHNCQVFKSEQHIVQHKLKVLECFLMFRVNTFICSTSFILLDFHIEHEISSREITI